MARPKIKIDTDVVEKLAMIHCTMIEIASVVGCSVDTLERRYADLIKKAKDKGRASLRRLQYEKAQQGNVTMMIWLGKQLLGQSDKMDQTYSKPIEPTVVKLSTGEAIIWGLKDDVKAMEKK